MAPPPVEELVDRSRQNVIPDHRDTCEWESCLKELQDKLLPRITEAQSILDALLAEQARLDASYQTCRSFRAPIRKLAPELLGYIFTWCLPIEGIVSPAKYGVPLLFLSVSCLWRDVALSTAQLWSSLRITHHIPKLSRGLAMRNAMQLRKTAMQTWFARAASLPLSISLENLSPFEISNALVMYSSRCRYFEITIGVKFSGKITTPSHTQFSELGTLRVVLQKGGEMQWEVDTTSFHKLHEVQWEDQNIYKAGRNPPFPVFPWDTLERLTLTFHGAMRLELRGILEQLSHCRSLKHAEIIINCCNGTAPIPVLLPNLTSLLLTVNIGRFEIMKSLATPKLRELTLRCGILDMSELSSFAQRSNFSLRSLSLQRVFSPFDSTHVSPLSECLESLGATLESLCIAHSPAIIKTYELDMLTRAPDKQYACPRLQKFHLIGCVDRSVQQGVFGAMICSRLSGQGSSSEHTILKSLRVDSSQPDLPELRVFEDLGLELIVVDGIVDL